MTKNTNIKTKFQQKCKTKNISALKMTGQNIVWIKRESYIMANMILVVCSIAPSQVGFLFMEFNYFHIVFH